MSPVNDIYPWISYHIGRHNTLATIKPTLTNRYMRDFTIEKIRLCACMKRRSTVENVKVPQIACVCAHDEYWSTYILWFDINVEFCRTILKAISQQASSWLVVANFADEVQPWSKVYRQYRYPLTTFVTRISLLFGVYIHVSDIPFIKVKNNIKNDYPPKCANYMCIHWLIVWNWYWKLNAFGFRLYTVKITRNFICRRN